MINIQNTKNYNHQRHVKERNITPVEQLVSTSCRGMTFFNAFNLFLQLKARILSSFYPYPIRYRQYLAGVIFFSFSFPKFPRVIFVSLDLLVILKKELSLVST